MNNNCSGNPVEFTTCFKRLWLIGQGPHALLEGRDLIIYRLFLEQLLEKF